ncbi:MAG: hypothetical protein H7834_16290 [Magnetococcus sp. YQC-9]
MAESLIGVIDDLRDYWALTVRQVYYQSVARLLVSNNQNEYRRISKILVDLREEELVPWEAIIDLTRTTSKKRGMPNLMEHLREHWEMVLNPRYYGRCYIQDQDVYLELSVEKDALRRLVEDAAYPYCTRVSCTRGQPSATLVNTLGERFDKAMSQGKTPLLLHMGDLDPTGVQVPISIQKALFDRYGLHVDVQQIALTPEQCREFNLPQSIDAAKESDPNFRRWHERFGDQAPTELDALHPKIIKQLVVEALETRYDMDEIDLQLQAEKEERAVLAKMRTAAEGFLLKQFPDIMREVVESGY